MKVPEQLPRFVEVGGGRLLLPLEDVIGHYLDSLFPGMEIVERAVFRVTRDADMELSDDADDLLEAVQAEIRRRRFGDVVRRRGRVVDVRARCSTQLRTGLACRATRRSTRSTGMLDLSEVMQIAALDRPELKDEPWRPITQARLHAAHGERRPVRRDPPRRRLRPPPVRVVRDERRALHRRGVDRPGGPRAEDDRLPDERGVADRPGARPRGRGGQAERLPRRAEGALRRAPQHRAGRARSSRRASTSPTASRISRSTRRRRSSSAARATGSAATSTSAPATTTRYGAPLRGRRHLHGRRGHRRRRRRPLQLPDRLRPARRSSASCSSRRRRSARASSALIRQVAAAAADGKRAEIKLKVNALTDPAIIEELIAAADAGAKIDIIARSICMLRPVERADHGPQRRSAASSSTAGSSSSTPATRATT